MRFALPQVARDDTSSAQLDVAMQTANDADANPASFTKA
jgi:hypothetical protein